VNTRIKLLRKNLDLTQEEFAAKIKLSRNFIAQIEIGTKEPSDRTISDICREFNVNEEWLRYGTGEMHIPMQKT
jgi:transcriptional regulator with XRE-family HTH domain